MLPVQRKTRTQTRKGRSHHAIDTPVLVSCPHSGVAKRPHTVCPETGYVPPNGNRPGFFLDIKLFRNKKNR